MHGTRFMANSYYKPCVSLLLAVLQLATGACKLALQHSLSGLAQPDHAQLQDNCFLFSSRVGIFIIQTWVREPAVIVMCSVAVPVPAMVSKTLE